MASYIDVRSKLYRYLDPREALNLLVEGIERRTITLDIREAQGKVLAENIYSPVDRPWTDLSHMDGFAIKSKDVMGARSTSPVKLRIVKGVDSRNAHRYTLRGGEAVLVETGYPIPKGADAVIPIESVRVEEEYIIVYSSVKPGHNITPKAGDVAKGELIATKGTIISPALQKLLIDLGVKEVEVYDDPRVIIAGIGDELVDDVFAPTTSKMPSSSTYMVKGVLEYYGARVEDIVILPDNPDIIVGKIKEWLNHVDIVVTIGGVSMGPRDYAWISLRERLGVDKYFRGLKVQPGRATSGLRIGGKVVVNLPGLPQSTLVGLVFILIPLVNYLRGVGAHIKLPYTIAKNKETVRIEKYPGFQRVRYVELDNGYAKILAEIDSYYVKPIALANGFTIIRPGKTVVEKNEEIKVYHLPPIHNMKAVEKIP